MKQKKNNLDERQEQLLLKIEHNGYWFAFWGLFVVLMAQLIVFDYDLSYVYGEMIIFFPVCIYMVIACIRRGIWDRRLKASRKNNLLISLLAGVISGLITGISNYMDFDILWVALLAFGMTCFLTFILCYILLSFSMKRCFKKQRELESMYEDEE